MPNGVPHAQTFSNVIAIIEKKADHILALKGNQGNRHTEA